jgi:hypothetical protein
MKGPSIIYIVQYRIKNNAFHHPSPCQPALSFDGAWLDLSRYCVGQKSKEDAGRFQKAAVIIACGFGLLLHEASARGSLGRRSLSKMDRNRTHSRHLKKGCQCGNRARKRNINSKTRCPTGAASTRADLLARRKFLEKDC